MCDADAPGPEFYSDGWIRARKEHECCACDEVVRVGDLYHYAKGKWDGDFDTFKHCARCWRLFALLNDLRPGEVALGLDCGEIYDGAPEDPMHIMAFMTVDEAQRYAARQRPAPRDELADKAAEYVRYGNPTEHRLRLREWARGA